MKHWVPLSIKDPLLLQIVLYTASCFLNETGRIPKMLVWAYKGGVHRMLNDHLSAPKTQISDVAIMGASQMVMDSWYWGTTDELMAHMAGLKTMVKMRGGFQDMGMQGFLAKTALMSVIKILNTLSPNQPHFTDKSTETTLPSQSPIILVQPCMENRGLNSAMNSWFLFKSPLTRLSYLTGPPFSAQEARRSCTQALLRF